MPLGERVQALPGNELLRDLPLELSRNGWAASFRNHGRLAPEIRTVLLDGRCWPPVASSSFQKRAFRDRAGAVYQKLGFSLTPRAAHEDRMDTSNRLAQFGARNFIELLEVDLPEKLARRRRPGIGDSLTRPEPNIHVATPFGERRGSDLRGSTRGRPGAPLIFFWTPSRRSDREKLQSLQANSGLLRRRVQFFSGGVRELGWGDAQDGHCRARPEAAKLRRGR